MRDWRCQHQLSEVARHRADERRARRRTSASGFGATDGGGMSLTAEIEPIHRRRRGSRTSQTRFAALAKRSILDGLGLAVAGSRSAAAEIARHEIESYGALPRGRLGAGHGPALPARFAAFLNGLAIHADDYDDTQLAVAARPRLRPADPPDRPGPAGRACARRA